MRIYIIKKCHHRNPRAEQLKTEKADSTDIEIVESERCHTPNLKGVSKFIYLKDLYQNQIVNELSKLEFSYKELLETQMSKS